MTSPQILIAAVVLAGSLPWAIARTWTDTQGRKIEAEMVRLDGDMVVVNKDGKELRLPKAKLSQEDVAYAESWKPGAPAVPAAGELMLLGQPIIRGGKRTVIERAYTPETASEVKKGILELQREREKMEARFKIPEKDRQSPSPPETGLKLAIAVPADFDQTKAPNVFVALTPINNDKERAGGNFAVFDRYVKSCLANGWVCLTIDSDVGVPGSHATLPAAITLIEKEWPAMAQARYAAGGFSGGAKSCWRTIAELLKMKRNVVGAFMGGCNADLSGHFREEVGTPGSGYRSIKAFLSTGKDDKIAPPAKTEKVVTSLNESGVRKTKFEMYEGGHHLHDEHVVAALKWFATEGD